MSRRNIGKSTVHRLLLQSAPGGRVSDDAAEEAQKSVVEYLEKAGQAAADHLAIAKRKTVNKDIAEKVLMNGCMGVTKSALKYTQGEQRGLAVAGCVRAFSHEGKKGKKSSGLGFNISDEAKKMIAAGAEAFVDQLGKRARQVVVEMTTKKEDPRSTIKGRDIRVALLAM